MGYLRLKVKPSKMQNSFDGDGAHWRAKQAARDAAECEVYVDPHDGTRMTLRQHLDRLRAAGLTETERAVRLQACRPVED